jgi:hypothetical protein
VATEEVLNDEAVNGWLDQEEECTRRKLIPSGGFIAESGEEYGFYSRFILCLREEV